MSSVAFDTLAPVARSIALPRSLARARRRRRPSREVLLVALLLLAVALAHGINMFHFPYYESDEGTYVSQARSFVEQSRLAPYTYWYDHAPAGWMLLGVWAKLTGGFSSFGASINTGRVLMLVLHLGSCIAMYAVVRRLTGRPWAAALAVMAFSFAPSGIYYQRRVLLDNIAVFWTLAAIAALPPRPKLGRALLAAGCFGIALLSKESVVFLTPALVLAAAWTAPRSQRLLTGSLFAAVCGSLVSLYFLYALLKGELFATGTRFGGTRPHVSLLETLHFQSSRTGHGVFGPHSTFRLSFLEWFANGPVWAVLAVIATAWIVILAIWQPRARLVAACLVAYWVYLMRGGLVLNFYVVPLYAFVALALGVAAGCTWPEGRTARRRSWWSGVRATTAAAVAIAIAVGFVGSYDRQFGMDLFTSDQTTGQMQAVRWLQQRDEPGLAAIDNYGYVDLHPARPYPLRTEYYWKLDLDPAAQRQARNDSRDIDYLAVTNQLRNDLNSLPFTRQAMQSSKPLVTFDSGGWPVTILANSTPQRFLRASWRSYKQQFIRGGRVIDPQTGGRTTSEGQAYGLLRAVWSDDRATFDSLLQWSDAHLGSDAGLWRWRWTPSDGPSQETSASDADTDAALALVLAARRWRHEDYATRAGSIVQALWRHDVTRVHGAPVMTAGPWAHTGRTATLNPSYFNPAAYREFAALDRAHPWHRVVDTSLTALRACSGTGLPPDWCTVDTGTGRVVSRTSPDGAPPAYGYEAFRSSWRLALDWFWNRDRRVLRAAEVFRPLIDSYRRDHRLAPEYGADGRPVASYSSAAVYGGDLGAFAMLDPAAEQQVYDTGLATAWDEDATVSAWRDRDSYFTQNWAWFGTALHVRGLYDFR